ncbi:MAG: tRNA guanosine(15) transglycosylase TgtA [Candidatus Heimdallarchaeota archaeon]|nr:MAG: tRNA guanosine(15) transglycosylase TgtA [Candidatus Heimdallarchaeota archaeon]
MFSIRKKDGLARIGTITTKHGKISTPTLLPVINPNRQLLHPEEMVKCGSEAFITNAYLLYKDSVNREKVLKEGLHKYIGFSGPLMTDSGAFQLMEYGEVSVTNKEITEFQEKIGSDIGVFLDIPIKKGTYEDTKVALEETLRRADEHIHHRNSISSTLWAGPIQGGKYLELIKDSCEKMAQKDFIVHPIGSVVPLLEAYDFKTIVKIILTAKQHLPPNRPTHLFGAGHPMLFAVAVFLGIDMFDSAAYVLYAKGNRYITVSGTEYLKDLEYLPCSCEVCQNYSVTELKQVDQDVRTNLLAKHNLCVSLEEIRRIKQAIIEGRLYELVLARVMNHPSLARSLSLLFGISTSQFIEFYEPISKARSLLITHPILAFQPLLLRYRKRILERFYFWSSRLLIGQDYQHLRSSSSYQVIRVSPLFGIIPDELRGVFPLVQHERVPMTYSPEIINFISQFLEKYKRNFEQIEVHPSIDLDVDILQEFSSYDGTKAKEKLNEAHIVKAILDYQFGVGTHLVLSGKTIFVERSKRTGILRHFSDESGILGTFRASDFVIVPTKDFAHKLHNYIPAPRLRVVAKSESIPYISRNKDLLAKFVLNVDSEIRCGEEVFIVDEKDSFLNFGKSLLSAPEMIAFNRGVAVRVRR